MLRNLLGKVAVTIVSCCGFAFAALLFIYAASPWIDHKEIPVFRSRWSDTVLFGVIALICAFVTTRLVQGRRWAWWTAFTVSMLILGLGAFLLYSSLHPENDFARSESGFGLGIAVILITPSLISIVLLALPCVRQRSPRIPNYCKIAIELFEGFTGVWCLLDSFLCI